MRLIGILGGTFDPVHIGHLRLAIECQEQIGLAQVRLIPNGTPNHRERAIASDASRLEMLDLATRPSPLTVDPREIERGGVSYMVDTLSSLKEEFPDDALCLIIGVDAYLGLPAWDRWETLFELAHIVVATRPSVEIAPQAVLRAATEARIVSTRDALLSQTSGQVFFVDIPLLDVSASDIRKKCRSGLDISWLVPDGVAEIIKRKKLYIS